jgi:nucleoside-diphosphate-sugar epimerase
MPLKVALTGATGFVGRNAVAELLDCKHDVTALVRDGTKARLPNNVRQVNGDLQNVAALDELTIGADVVVHIAGLIGAVSGEDYFIVNAEGTRAVVEAAKRNDVKRLVYVSSLSAREPQLSTYGASKLAGEEAAMESGSGISTAILRPPAVYGPGDKATFPLLKALTQSLAIIPGRADGRFSLIYVRDLARIIVEAAIGNRTGTIELGDGCVPGHDWKELAEIASGLESKTIRPLFLPKPIPYAIGAFADVAAKLRRKPSMISRDKINELYHINWVSQGEGWGLKNPTPFAQGFAETLAWYRQEGWVANKTKTKIAT